MLLQDFVLGKRFSQWLHLQGCPWLRGIPSYKAPAGIRQKKTILHEGGCWQTKWLLAQEGRRDACKVEDVCWRLCAAPNPCCALWDVLRDTRGTPCRAGGPVTTVPPLPGGPERVMATHLLPTCRVPRAASATDQRDGMYRRMWEKCVATETDAEPLSGTGARGTLGEMWCPRRLPWAGRMLPHRLASPSLAAWRRCPPPPRSACARTRVQWPDRPCSALGGRDRGGTSLVKEHDLPSAFWISSLACQTCKKKKKSPCLQLGHPLVQPPQSPQNKEMRSLTANIA